MLTTYINKLLNVIFIHPIVSFFSFPIMISVKFVSVLVMLAAFLAMARAACQCDDADQACVSRCGK